MPSGIAVTLVILVLLAINGQLGTAAIVVFILLLGIVGLVIAAAVSNRNEQKKYQAAAAHREKLNSPEYQRQRIQELKQQLEEKLK